MGKIIINNRGRDNITIGSRSRDNITIGDAGDASAIWGKIHGNINSQQDLMDMLQSINDDLLPLIYAGL
jgi:hypothetical protein